MRPKAGLNIETAITELAVGEALISFLDVKGRPTETERVFVLLPGSKIGPITPAERQSVLQGSLVAGVYEQALDRESAFERLRGTTPVSDMSPRTAGSSPAEEQGGLLGGFSALLFGSKGPRGGQHDGIAQIVVKNAVRAVGSSIGREIVRGVLGSLLGGGSRRR
jgi:DNA helicase HerA-like ATPase